MPRLSSSASRSLYALLIANTLSWLGTSFTQIAVPWLVLHQTGSALLTGAVALSGQLGHMLSLLFSTHVVDTLGYRRVSIMTDLSSAVVVALLPMAAFFDRPSVELIAVLAFVQALFDAPGNTAKASLIPDLAQSAHMRLERANVISEVAESGTQWVGPLLAGILITVIGAVHILWFDAASFLISALLVWKLTQPEHARPISFPSGKADNLWAGWQFLFQDAPLRAIYFSSLVFGSSMAALFTVMLPVFARERSGTAIGLGMLVGAFGAGSVVGAVLYGRYGQHWSQRRTFLVGVWGLCGIFGALALGVTMSWAVFSCFLGGVVSGPNGPLIATMLQERAPTPIRARVIGAASMLGMSASPIGVLLAGVLIESFSLQFTLQSTAVLFAITVILVSADPRWKEEKCC